MNHVSKRKLAICDIGQHTKHILHFFWDEAKIRFEVLASNVVNDRISPPQRPVTGQMPVRYTGKVTPDIGEYSTTEFIAAYVKWRFL